ncbi:MAG: hypothetical protein EHM35_00740 [Planctomycetaceae bacterium]|nr:MAG: hypothetical protein EHM35_00740 [Planctomycetaceae bacterium]
MTQDWTKDESALIELAVETARSGGHVSFLATLLLAGPLWSRSHAEIVAEITCRLTKLSGRGTILDDAGVADRNDSTDGPAGPPVRA